MATHTLSKRERVCGMRLTDRLFKEPGSRSMATFPLRVVWIEKERGECEPPVQILVSVSKRRYKRAVKRNRVKRQIREAYRLAKQPLCEKLEAQPHRAIVLAFIWLAEELYPSKKVAECVKLLLRRIEEKI